ncbi:tetratricopeptide repeat protein [Phaeobacter sp.]|uniref:tetratricopeptide repeat protein n=1 Tax=Phaeobacter sp. TaxID=1902409 RepID=UPI0025E92B01|nr:tetratricopeptide repeat protein [Phaeobacter sp.]
MSDTDSFIDEVTEEVRRDRLFLMLKRYGWIGGVAVALIVGGAAYREYDRAQTAAAAQALGDQMIAALDQNDSAERAEALGAIAADTASGQALQKLLEAGALVEAGDREAAVAALNLVGSNGDVAEIYRHIATFRALVLQQDTLSAADRRLQFEALARPGAPLDLLAKEQLALIDIELGETDAAIIKLQEITEAADATADLKDRATQVIVALGGSLDAAEPQDG